MNSELCRSLSICHGHGCAVCGQPRWFLLQRNVRFCKYVESRRMATKASFSGSSAPELNRLRTEGNKDMHAWHAAIWRESSNMFSTFCFLTCPNFLPGHWRSSQCSSGALGGVEAKQTCAIECLVQDYHGQSLGPYLLTNKDNSRYKLSIVFLTGGNAFLAPVGFWVSWGCQSLLRVFWIERSVIASYRGWFLLSVFEFSVLWAGESSLL